MKTHIAGAFLLSFSLSAALASAAPMQTSGRSVLDGCGNVFVARGVEQILGKELPPGNDWVRSRSDSITSPIRRRKPPTTEH